MSLFLGIDLGTTYFKAGIFDEKGKLIGLGRQSVKKEIADNTYCELAVNVFWNTIRLCIAEAMQNAGVSPKDIKAVSYSSQANSFLLLDSCDEPLTPLILWSDERVKEESEPLRLLTQRPDFTAITGLGIKPQQDSLIAKIDWYQKKRPSLWNKVESIMSISDYLVFSLTGQKVSDFGTSSMTGLINIKERKWWHKALDLFQIEESSLGLPLNSGTLAGEITEKGSRLIGLCKKTFLFLGGLDHHMVAIGAGVPCLKFISESTGTVLACVNYCRGYEPCEGVNTAVGLEEDRYFRMAYNCNGAASLEWYQKKYAHGFTIPDLLEMAAKIEIGCEGLIAQPCAYKFSDLNGFKNVNDRYQAAHFVRAILESTGWSLLNLIEKVEEKDNEPKEIVSSGGGARSHLWVQIKADILNRVFLIPECSELACKGAAMLCAVGTFHFKNMEEAIKNQIRIEKIIYPDSVNVEKYKNIKI